MSVRRVVFIAALGLAAAAGPAWAQMQPGAGQQAPPCVKKFMSLRDIAATKAKTLEAVGKRKQKPTAQEACHLFNVFSTAEGNLLKYATENATWCGIPPQVVEQMKKAHARTTVTRTRICSVAAAQQARPRGPSLSDALSGPVPDADNIKTGRGGAFDTLTGSPIGSR